MSIGQNELNGDGRHPAQIVRAVMAEIVPDLEKRLSLEIGSGKFTGSIEIVTYINESNYSAHVITTTEKKHGSNKGKPLSSYQRRRA